MHLALAAALLMAATHLTPELSDSRLPEAASRTSAVILAVPDPDANVSKPDHCAPANAQSAYRDLSGMALIPPASPATHENPGPHP